MRLLARIVAMSALVAGCTNKTVPISVQVVTTSCGTANPMMGVTTFRLRVFGDGLTQNCQSTTCPGPLVSTSSVDSTSSGNAQIPSIPAGTNRQIEIAAFAGAPPNGTIVSVGQTPRFTIPDKVDPTAPPLQFTVFLRTPNAFTPTCDGSSMGNPDNPTFMNTARGAHTATALADGTVLIVGGYTGDPTAPTTTPTGKAEIFNPSVTGNTSVGPGNFFAGPELEEPRAFHTATLLPPPLNNLWVAGGEQSPTNLFSDTWTYNPSQQTWNQDIDLEGPRSRHASVLDTTSAAPAVITFGGLTQTAIGSTFLSNVIEWFDVNNDKEKPGAGTLLGGRLNGATVPLDFSTGIAIAIVAGRSGFACPGTPPVCLDGSMPGCAPNTMCPAGSPYSCPPYLKCLDGTMCDSGSQCTPTTMYPCATRCVNDDTECGPNTPCVTFRSDLSFILNFNTVPDPTCNLVTATGYQVDPCEGTLSVGTNAVEDLACAPFSTTTRLICCGGQAAIAGTDQDQCTAVRLDCSPGTLTAPALSEPRSLPCAVTLADGRVLFAGGLSTSTLMSSSAAELYQADSAFSKVCQAMSVGQLNDARFDHTCTLLPDGTVLVAGGFQSNSSGVTALRTAEIFQPMPIDAAQPCQ
jgi:hypothetical protein